MKQDVHVYNARTAVAGDSDFAREVLLRPSGVHGPSDAKRRPARFAHAAPRGVRVARTLKGMTVPTMGEDLLASPPDPRRRR